MRHIDFTRYEGRQGDAANDLIARERKEQSTPRGWNRIEGDTQSHERDALHAEYERRAEASQSVPTPQELLHDSCTPYWAAEVIRVALTKDCCDASAVLSVLAKSFDARTKKILGL